MNSIQESGIATEQISVKQIFICDICKKQFASELEVTNHTCITYG